MMDPLNRSQVLPPVQEPGKPDNSLAEWDRKVESTLRRVGRMAWTYTLLGLTVYGGGSVGLILWLHDKPMLVTLVVMFFFQLCLIWFGTQAIFRCIAGGFHVGLMMNRETVPVFSRMNRSLDQAAGRLEQASLDIKASGDRIHGEVKRLADQMERPIRPPSPRPLAGPPIPVELKDGGNGQASG